uniref:FBA_2 domain-containing protein n=2 Tax=Caenorhabditis tropicalis TaxID=1561998 RepID=A0A1I7URQ4_9PELO
MSSHIELFRFPQLVQEEIVKEMDGRELMNLYFFRLDDLADIQSEGCEEPFRRRKFGETCNQYLDKMFGTIETLSVWVDCKRKFESFGEQTLEANFVRRNFVYPTYLESLWESYVHYFDRKYRKSDGLLPANVYLNNTRKIAIDACQEVKVDSLLQFNRTYAFLFETRLIDNDFNRLIRNWLDGGQPNLKALILWQESNLSIDPATVLQGFETHPYDEQQRARHYFLIPQFEKKFEDFKSFLDCRKGSDILRQDGKRCTVRIWERSVFCFYVWHESFPST